MTLFMRSKLPHRSHTKKKTMKQNSQSFKYRGMKLKKKIQSIKGLKNKSNGNQKKQLPNLV
jgi:hypothetical protein